MALQTQLISPTVERAPPVRAPEDQPLTTFSMLLSARGVDFLVVGGRAASHADLLVLPTAENIRRLLLALTDFGFGSLGVRAEDFRGHATLTLGRAPRQLTLTTYLPGVELSAAWSRRVAGTIGGVPVYFVDYALDV